MEIAMATSTQAAGFGRWRSGLGRFSPYLYLLPAALVIIVFRFVPIIYSVRISLYRWGIAGAGAFLGIGNYAEMMHDSIFWRSMLNASYYVIGVVPLGIVLSLGTAVLLKSKIRGLGVYRTVYFLPVVTSIIAISMVWKWIYNPQRGLANYLLTRLHLPALQWLEEPRGIVDMALSSLGLGVPDWLAGPSLALVALIILSIWKGLGYNVVIFLAGLQNIPQQYYEAARIDGAGRWAQLRHVTWPLLSPTTFYVLVMTTIVSFQVFAPVWLITGPPAGGPLGTTRVIVYYLYQRAFDEGRYGYGSAIAFALFLVILCLTLAQRLVLERRVHY
jgi:multiple sugar transport system permease protein